MASLSKTALKIFFQNTSQQSHIPLNVRNVSKSLSLQDISFILKRAKNHKELSQVIKVDDPLCTRFLGRELANSEHIIGRGTIMVENPLVRPEFGSFL
jgi:hypothetical protein